MVAPLAVKLVLAPVQMLVLEDTVTVGKVFTVIVTVAVFVHPLELVPVTVYVVVVVGLAVTVAPVVELNPVDGVHAYVVAPLAVRLVEFPVHILVLDETVTVGNEFTVTVFVATLVHPFA